MRQFFKVLYQSKKSKARLGEIRTDHGVIKTPAFVAVGTKGTIKSIIPSLLKDIGTQVAFVNTYHLVTHPGAEVIAKGGGIHQYANLNMPLMSDSGGFQVFSLAQNRKGSTTKFFDAMGTPTPLKRKKFVVSPFKNNTKKVDIRGEEEPILVKIEEDGVKFRSTFDGSLIEFTPEKSIEYQRQIGADINMAFDECISYGVDYQYAKEATERTHRWLKRCIDYKARLLNFLSPLKSSRIREVQSCKKLKIPPSQFLYGVIQGATFEDLRKKSAEFVVSQPVDGIAIGGVSVGESKKEMRKQVFWVSPFLPKDRPVHLLGVGQFDDILDLVGYGIDTFDCVEPTRLARMGIIYQLKIQNSKFKIDLEEVDILKGKYRKDFSPVDENCSCYVCQNFTKSYLHHLFKQKELLAYTLATYHNLFVMERFFDFIREMIINNQI